MLGHHLHCASDIAAFHSVDPDQLGHAIGGREIDLGLAVAEDMDMGGFVVIDEDDDAQSMGSVDSTIEYITYRVGFFNWARTPLEPVIKGEHCLPE